MIKGKPDSARIAELVKKIENSLNNRAYMKKSNKVLTYNDVFNEKIKRKK